MACGPSARASSTVRVRRAGCEAAISPRWRDTQEVVEAVFHRWPSLSKSTTCHGRRAGERGEQAGAQAQPRAWALSPHGQPVRRAGSGKVLATRHRCEQKMQASCPLADSPRCRRFRNHCRASQSTFIDFKCGKQLLVHRLAHPSPHTLSEARRTQKKSHRMSF